MQETVSRPAGCLLLFSAGSHQTDAIDLASSDTLCLALYARVHVREGYHSSVMCMVRRLAAVFIRPLPAPATR